MKFRIWHPQVNKFVQDIYYGYSLSSRGTLYRYTAPMWQEVVQFSMGQKDKNGQEIYEGDIVSVVDKDNIFVVKRGIVTRIMKSHSDREFRVEINGFYFEQGGRPYFSIVDEEWHDLNETEVIGNVFENPELI